MQKQQDQLVSKQRAEAKTYPAAVAQRSEVSARVRRYRVIKQSKRERRKSCREGEADNRGRKGYKIRWARKQGRKMRGKEAEVTF